MKHAISKWQVIGLYGLVIGLALLVYFVGKQQLYQGRANLDVSRTFTVTSSDPSKPVSCSGTTCTTDADDVTIQFNDSQTQDLLNSLP